ncbi:MAG: trypsin-like peptidase domain-containing protein [Gemmatimonadota bacterium]|nr:trypsin-like peptidase domain-containing protein [Gemmatimonadota bacterium]
MSERFREVSDAVVVLYTVEREAAADPRAGQVALPGLGSGVLIDREGHVLTAAHVVETADQIEIEFRDGTRVGGRVLASDAASDVALVKIPAIPAGVDPVPIGDSDLVEVGDQVFVVGAPYGLGHTLTVGHVSGRRADFDEELDLGVEFFQTDAAINQGNSGGPMFNLDGEVVGIVSYILTQSGGFEGLGFVATSNAAYEVLFNRRMYWSGMTGILIEGELAGAFNIPQEAGYLVQKVAHESPAEELGMVAGVVPIEILDRTILIGGDVLLEVDGIEISRSTFGRIRNYMSALEPGVEYRVAVLRAGERLELTGVR